MSQRNLHAQPYAFPAGKLEALSEYLNENTQYDTDSGCLLWTGLVDAEGSPRGSQPIAKQFGSYRIARLAWRAHHGTKLDAQTKLTTRCGNPLCVNPHHLKERDANDKFKLSTPHYGWRRQGSVGALQVGKQVFQAQDVYSYQTDWGRLPKDDPSKGLAWLFRSEVCWPADYPVTRKAQERLEAIRAIRRCPIRATLTVLPCGFHRYDLPVGITPIPYTELPAERYTPLPSIDDEDDAPASAPEGLWDLAA